ncbi:Uncharacterized protein ACO02O_04410 [Dirofilaria immitis]
MAQQLYETGELGGWVSHCQLGRWLGRLLSVVRALTRRLSLHFFTFLRQRAACVRTLDVLTCIAYQSIQYSCAG